MEISGHNPWQGHGPPEVLPEDIYGTGSLDLCLAFDEWPSQNHDGKVSEIYREPIIDI